MAATRSLDPGVDAARGTRDARGALSAPGARGARGACGGPEGPDGDRDGDREREAAPPEAPGTATKEAVQEETEAVVSLGFPWNVIVWDDPVNLMSYVVYVFQRLFGYPRDQATRLMLEVHHKGRSLVASADRERAEYYVTRLHGYGLQATLERGKAS